VKINLSVPADGIVMLNDSFYPGWKAYVDGKEEPIRRTNFLFRGVFVGPKDKELIFRYEPWSFKTGVALACLALIILAALCIVEKRRNRRLPREDAPIEIEHVTTGRSSQEQA
jgi:uncharacterized membrane protein YfhO